MSKSPCPYFKTCGGCQLMDFSYGEQLELKKKMVENSLADEGLTALTVKPVLGMKIPWYYRNKVQFPIRRQNNRLQMGYFMKGTHEVVNINECLIQDPNLTEIARQARVIFEDRDLSAYDEKTGQGVLRHFVARSSLRTNEVFLGLVINGRKLPAAFSVAAEIKKRERTMQRLAAKCSDYPQAGEKKRIVGIVQNSNNSRGNVILGQQNTTLFGTPFYKEKLGRFFFMVRLNSFFQVNPIMAERLYNIVKELADLTGAETVVDAYAGLGAIAFWVAENAAKVICIEENEEAAADTLKNARANHLGNIVVEPGTVERKIGRRMDVLILDPPRSGVSELALKQILGHTPKTIIYVSCNPKTLARDVRRLLEAGYHAEDVQPLDMFPQTDHVEAVIKLQRPV